MSVRCGRRGLAGRLLDAREMLEIHRTHLAIRIALGLTLVGACTDRGDDTDDAAALATATSAVTASATLLVSGDFASTSTTRTIVQNELASNPAAKLLAIGDMSYTAPYADNDPWLSWTGQTFPVMGNHEFNSVAGTGGQQPFDLFNGHNAAGNHTFPAITSGGVATFDFAYSFEVTPGWLLVVLNTGVNCKQQSCTQQATRLTSWITSWRGAHAGKGCVIVAMHTARWSTMFSGDPDNAPWAGGVAPIWSAAITNKADIVLQGHVHVYEEFTKLGVNGESLAAGAKLFTVGSGGRGQVKPLQSNIAASQLIAARGAPINGVLKLGLYPGSYGYKFETAASAGSPASSVVCNVP
jgi:hypothetical protein